MAIVNPEETRVTVEELKDNLTLTIPVKRNWFIFIFLGFWLCGWAVGELTVLGSLIGGSSFFNFKSSNMNPGIFAGGLFMIVWLCGWSIGGCFAIIAWLYQLKGKETLILNDQYLSHVRDFVVYKKSREYLKEHVKHLRISNSPASIFNISPERAFEFWGLAGGTIAFDYGSKTIRVGTGLDEAEANPLIKKLIKFGKL